MKTKERIENLEPSEGEVYREIEKTADKGLTPRECDDALGFVPGTSKQYFYALVDLDLIQPVRERVGRNTPVRVRRGGSSTDDLVYQVRLLARARKKAQEISREDA